MRYNPPTRINNKASHNPKAGLEQAASAVQIIKLGLDVHADLIVVVSMLDHSIQQPPQRFTPQKSRPGLPASSVRPKKSTVVTKQSDLEIGPLVSWL
jgi:hypothetical protein